MVDRIVKFIYISKYRTQLLKLLEDMQNDNLSGYDIKVLKGKKGYKRIRVGDVRVIFVVIGGENNIVNINNRGDIY